MEEKIGGRSPVRIGLYGSSDVVEALLGDESSGQRINRLLEERFEGRFAADITSLAAKPWNLLVDEVERDGVKPADLDVLVLSMAANIGRGEVPPDSIDELVSRLIRSLKTATSAHVVVFNGSSIDPGHHVVGYRNVGSTTSEIIRRWNLAILRVSMEQGISIIDVDRLVAEAGATGNVVAALRYSETMKDVICHEFVRVLADIGFFEPRPLLAQLGRMSGA